MFAVAAATAVMVVSQNSSAHASMEYFEYIYAIYALYVVLKFFVAHPSNVWDSSARFWLSSDVNVNTTKKEEECIHTLIHSSVPSCERDHVYCV